VRRRVVITGAGALSPLGDSPAALHSALAAGRSALKPIELFRLDGLGPRRAGEIRPFEPHAYLGDRNLRPVDRTSRLLLVAAQQALDASGWTAELRAEREVGLVLGTTFCSIKTIAEFDRRGLQLGPSHASPLDFANSVINAAAGQTAIWHGLRGVNSTVAGGEAAGLMAIANAVDLIATGRADALLAGGVEELCFESFFGYHKAGRLAPEDGRPVPFDGGRDGFAQSEGAALLVLESEDSARQRGAAILGEVLGHASAFDPSAGEGSEAAETIARTVRLACEEAATFGLGGIDEIGAWSAAANGSVKGDRFEALGAAAAFGARAADLPVVAIKAMLGEALGASGAFQAIDLLSSMADGVLPGIAGLESTEEGFPFGGITAETRRVDPGSLRRTLATAISADGNCCALVLGMVSGRPA
jgi:3-oxoacyl-[acyl-carrier-protein] synthase II